MLREVPNATQSNVGSISSAVNPVDVVALSLLQCKVQLVGGEVDEGLFFLYRGLHLHVHHPRLSCGAEVQFEVVRLAALSALIAPHDVRGATGVAAVHPVAQEGVDQLLSPLTDLRHVHGVV